MTKSNIAFTAPHQTATDAGMFILEQGGTATEAMVAAAATISVVYPHMNSIGGDGFWLIDRVDQETPMAIDACGRAASDLSSYQAVDQIPERGGKSAITQAATISGWHLALQQDKDAKLALSTILKPAIDAANNGFTVSESLQVASEKLFATEGRNQAFRDLYEQNGQPLKQGDTFANPILANVFEHLAEHGLMSFYNGPLAESFAQDLKDAGSVITLDDINATNAELVTPLTVSLGDVDCFNLPAPTQGIHSLVILSVINQLKHKAQDEVDWMHLLVEATKQSFNLRPQIWGDIDSVTELYKEALEHPTLSNLSNNISMSKAEKWPFNAAPGDTVWMAARDKNGQMVSFIQSIYWEFGSGVVMKQGGFTWNNRGISFSTDSSTVNGLAPNKKPAHTLNPAFAKYKDGRRLAYGTMGGEGQPQTQAKVFSDYTWRGKSIAEAVASPRWLLGRTWGDTSTDLKVEQTLASRVGLELDRLRHKWQTVPDNNEMMGHAGAILDAADKLEATADPRSDGKAEVKSTLEN